MRTPLPHLSRCGSIQPLCDALSHPFTPSPFGSPDSGLRLLDADWPVPVPGRPPSDVFDELADRLAAKADRYRLSRRLPFISRTGRSNIPRYKRPEPLAFFVRCDILSEADFVLTRRMERPQNQRWKALTQVMARCNDPLLCPYLRPNYILIKYPNRGTLE